MVLKQENKRDLITQLNQLFIAQTRPKRNAITKGLGSLDLLDFVQSQISESLAGIKFNY
jgi:hypothetical protein